MSARPLLGLTAALALGCGSAPPAPHPAPAAPAPARTAAASAQPAAAAAPAPTPCSALNGPAPRSIDTIARVEVHGNVRLPHASLCAALSSRAGDALDEEHIRRDIRELWESGLIDDVSVASEVTRSGRSVTFLIRERPLVRTWSIQGVLAANPVRVRELLVPEEQPFDPVTVRTKIDHVRQQYLDEGYRSVDIQFEVASVPDNKVDIKVEVKEGPRAIIKAIRLQGVGKSRESELRALIDTGAGHFNSVGTPYQADSLERDRLRMAAYYYDRGMLDIQVNTEQIAFTEDRAWLTVTIDVAEGPVYKLAKITCVGDLASTERKCLELLGARRGAVFNRAELVKGIERIHDFQTASRRGAEIVPQTDLDRAKRTVNFTIAINK